MKKTLTACFLVLLAVFVSMAGWGCSSGGGGNGESGDLINIVVAPANSSIGIGATQQFTATGTYSLGTTKDITSSVTWTSSNTGVATISGAGLATSKAAGSTTIEATSKGISGSATLTVTPAVSAGEIAFVSSRDDSSQVYVMNSDGTNERRVTSLTGGGLNPFWSPTGDKIVFTSWRDVYNELYIVNSDGTGEAALTTSANSWNDYPAWSPDGSKIAFVSYRTGKAQIYTMNADGSSQTRLTYATTPYNTGTLTFEAPSWSPDGNFIVCETSWFHIGGGIDDAGGLYLFSVSDGTYTQLTHSGDDHDAVWSPDGSKIAFWRTSSGSTDYGDIYVMNSDGSNQTRLAQGVNPSWSPDGSQIAFVSERDGEGGRLWVINSDGSGEECLIPSDLGVVAVPGWTPSWSPDGKQLLFEDNGAIYVVNADGSGLTKVTTLDAHAESGPVWSPE
jgi:TolB protein